MTEFWSLRVAFFYIATACLKSLRGSAYPPVVNGVGFYGCTHKPGEAVLYPQFAAWGATT